MRTISLWVVVFYLVIFIANPAFSSDNTPPNTLTYDLLPGTSIQQLSRDLEHLGIVKSAWWLSLRFRFHGKPMQAGEYEIDPKASLAHLVQQFTRGYVKGYYVTLVEGWRFSQFSDIISRQPLLIHQLTSPEIITETLHLPVHHPEGWFFPDTYQYTKGMSDEALYRQAHHRMLQKLEEAWTTRDSQLTLKNPYELLILASIIEKETAVQVEMPKISGVFHRRLLKNMRLQTDPTVIYGLGNTYTGRLHKKDLLKDTPYNTYTRTGLPPTPIAMPSWDALSAAAHPEPGDTYYFVAKGDGSHHFSATLSEHQAAIRQYASSIVFQ